MRYSLNGGFVNTAFQSQGRGGEGTARHGAKCTRSGAANAIARRYSQKPQAPNSLPQSREIDQ